ncbi:MAG: sodium:solute symporter family protein [Acidobacteria bacterium]|nr:sodium:solute symporter family protein [Acidobacteriota bacterium]
MAEWVWVPLIVISFLLISLYLGVRGGRGGSGTTADHVVAGRGLGLLLLFFVAVGEIYSSASFLGGPGWAYEHGVPILYSPMTGILAVLVMFWLGPRIQVAGKRLNLLTQAHYLSTRFESPALGNLAAVVVLIALCPYIAIQIIGAGHIFEVTTEGNVPYWLGSFIAFTVVAVYVYAGGLRGISYVAVFKGVFLLGVTVALVGFVVYSNYGGFTDMFQQIAARSPEHLTLPGARQFFGYTWWTTAVLNGVCGYFMWPHLFTNFFGAKSGDTIRRQAILTPAYHLVSLMLVMVGFAGILVIPALAQSDRIMMEMIMGTAAPIWLVSLLAAGALSASMITGATTTLAAAATLGHDLLQSRFRLSDRSLRRLIQVLVVVIIGAAYVFAMTVGTSLIFILLMAYGVISQFFPLVVASLYWRRCTAPGALAGFGVGTVVAVFFIVGPFPHPFDIHPGILGMIANTITLVVVSRFTTPPSREVVEMFIDTTPA